MPSYNKVLLMGNLTRDPELRYTPNNTAVLKLGLATNRRWRNQQGEQQEEVTFVDCTAFGRTAEVMNQYLRKGRPVFIEGRLKLDQWQDKEGNNRSRLEVVIESFQFVDTRGGEGEGGEGSSPAPARPTSAPAARSSGPAARPGPVAGPPPTGAAAEPGADIPF